MLVLVVIEETLRYATPSVDVVRCEPGSVLQQWALNEVHLTAEAVLHPQLSLEGVVEVLVLLFFVWAWTLLALRLLAPWLRAFAFRRSMRFLRARSALVNNFVG